MLNVNIALLAMNVMIRFANAAFLESKGINLNAFAFGIKLAALVCVFR